MAWSDAAKFFLFAISENSSRAETNTEEWKIFADRSSPREVEKCAVAKYQGSGVDEAGIDNTESTGRQ